MSDVRRNVRGAASLEVILKETVRLVGRHGYDSTTISRITRATERPASSIYWYFDTKDALIAAALESSYRSGPPENLPWRVFRQDTPVYDQLFTYLEPELQVAETEKPLRLGIMLALEGSASIPDVQAPFRRRRAGAQERIAQWWSHAFARDDAGTTDPAAVECMTALTLAFLDGHYVSDVAQDDQSPAERAEFVSSGLVGAYEALLAGGPAVIDDEPAIVALDLATDDDPDAGLLRVTRALVAENGYEGATIGRICERSGLKRSSVYWRHRDKDSLVHAAVAEPFCRLFDPLTHLPAPSPRWKDDVCDALATVLHTARANPDTVKSGLLLKAQRADPPTSAGEAIITNSLRIESVLALWLAHTPPLHGLQDDLGTRIAWAIGRLLEGLMLSPWLNSSPDDTVEVRDVVRLFRPMLDAVPL